MSNQPEQPNPPTSPPKPKRFLAVSRNIEGDEAGNRQRRKEAMARMMQRVMELDAQNPSKESEKP